MDWLHIATLHEIGSVEILMMLSNRMSIILSDWLSRTASLYAFFQNLMILFLSKKVAYLWLATRRLPDNLWMHGNWAEKYRDRPLIYKSQYHRISVLMYAAASSQSSSLDFSVGCIFFNLNTYYTAFPYFSESQQVLNQMVARLKLQNQIRSKI